MGPPVKNDIKRNQKYLNIPGNLVLNVDLFLNKRTNQLTTIGTLENGQSEEDIMTPKKLFKSKSHFVRENLSPYGWMLIVESNKEIRCSNIGNMC